MYKNLSMMFMLCCLFSCNWRKRNVPKVLGLGVLSVNTQYPIPLYKSEEDNLPFDTLKFKTNKSGTTSFISGIKLKPYLVSPGDSDNEGKDNVSKGLVRFPPELKFCVVDTGETYYRIITNETTMETVVIKKEPANAYYTEENMLFENSCSNCPDSKYNPRWYVYETWERYLKRAEYITKDKLVVYDAPGGKAIFENKDGAFVSFKVVAVNGEWIKVKELGTNDTQKSMVGWTKWREGAKKLVDIIERTYE